MRADVSSGNTEEFTATHSLEGRRHDRDVQEAQFLVLYVAYLRVSTREQGQSRLGLEAQCSAEGRVG